MNEASNGGSPLHDKPLLKTIVLLRSPGLEVPSAAPVANPSDLAKCAGAPTSRPHRAGWDVDGAEAAIRGAVSAIADKWGRYPATDRRQPSAGSAKYVPVQ